MLKSRHQWANRERRGGGDEWTFSNVQRGKQRVKMAVERAG